MTQPGILPCIENGVFPAISINKDVLFINIAISDSVSLKVNFWTGRYPGKTTPPNLLIAAAIPYYTPYGERGTRLRMWKIKSQDAGPRHGESHSVASDSLWPHGLYSPLNSPGQNTGVGSPSLLQGIFPTQGLNPGLPHCQQILYQLSHKGSSRILEWIAYPFSSGSSQPRNRTGVSCIAGGFFTRWAMRPQITGMHMQGMMSVRPDSCIFPRIEKCQVL